MRLPCHPHFAPLTLPLLLCPVWIRADTDADAALLEGQLPTILALMKNTKSAQVVRTLDAIPAGCGSGVISPSIVAYILVRVRTTSPSVPLYLPSFPVFP